MSRASYTGTAPSGPVADWPGRNADGAPIPVYRQPVRIDSGVRCEACLMHVDINGRCSCSE